MAAWRSPPSGQVKAATVPRSASIGTAELRLEGLGATLDVPTNRAVLAEFPQRNPRVARYDGEWIVFRKHPLRLAAAALSKALAVFALVVSGQ